MSDSKRNQDETKPLLREKHEDALEMLDLRYEKKRVRVFSQLVEDLEVLRSLAWYHVDESQKKGAELRNDLAEYRTELPKKIVSTSGIFGFLTENKFSDWPKIYEKLILSLQEYGKKCDEEFAAAAIRRTRIEHDEKEGIYKRLPEITNPRIKRAVETVISESKLTLEKAKENQSEARELQKILGEHLQEVIKQLSELRDRRKLPEGKSSSLFRSEDRDKTIRLEKVINDIGALIKKHPELGVSEGVTSAPSVSVNKSQFGG